MSLNYPGIPTQQAQPNQLINRYAPAAQPPISIQNPNMQGMHNQQAMALAGGAPMQTSPLAGMNSPLMQRYLSQQQMAMLQAPYQPQMPVQPPAQQQDSRQLWLASLSPEQRAMLGDGDRTNNKQLNQSLSPQQLALRQAFRQANMGMGV
jgi:hypothetical protein